MTELQRINGKTKHTVDQLAELLFTCQLVFLIDIHFFSCFFLLNFHLNLSILFYFIFNWINVFTAHTQNAQLKIFLWFFFTCKKKKGFCFFLFKLMSRRLKIFLNFSLERNFVFDFKLSMSRWMIMQNPHTWNILWTFNLRDFFCFDHLKFFLNDY